MKNQSNLPLISIITVNFNQSAVSCELIESLKKITYKNIETIVVDNGSKKDDPEIIHEKYPDVKYIKSEKNLGFAGGNNLGIKASKGKYCLFINNDTEVEKGFLEPLVDCLEKDNTIGMVSPKIRFFHTPDTIQYAGYTPMNPFTLRQELIGYRIVDKGQFDKGGETYSIHGAAVMVPMRVIKEVGMMAEVYFLYYEEHDWSFRIKKAGYKIVYLPASLVLHKESISTGRNSPLKIHYIARNRILYARRNYSGFQFLFNIIYLCLISVPKNSIMFLIKGRLDLFIAFWKAMLWNISHYKGLKANPKL